MSSTLAVTVVIILLTLAFDFINGFHDTATAVATSISTRALSPKAAIALCAIFNFIGAFLGTEVAKTVGDGIVDQNIIPLWVIAAVILGAIIWNLITWYFGIPSSSSHALIGSLIGGGIAYSHSINIVSWGTLFDEVILWLILSPIIGLIVGYIFMILLNWALRRCKPGPVNRIFSKLQVVSGALMALNHGGNDAQKSMGIITMALLSGGFLSTFEVPTWVIALCAIAMATGTSIGGQKIIKTMGSGVAKLNAVNGFAAQTGAAGVIGIATMFHAPVSTTHIITTTIMGVGASKNPKAVKWGVAKNIVWAWILTIPISACIAAIVVEIFKFVL